MRLLRRLRPLTLLGCLSLATAPALALPVPTQGVRQDGGAAAKPGAEPVNAQLRDAVTALRADRRAEAEKGFQAALRANPKQVEALLGLAELSFKSGNETEALRWLRQAQTVAPDRAEVQGALGRVLLAQGQLDPAEPLLRKAVEADPRGVPQRLSLADLLLRKGKTAESLALLQQARQIEPKNPLAAYALGMAQMRSGDRAGGEKQIREAAALEPTNPAPWLTLARTQTEGAKALAFIDEGLKKLPEQPELLMLRADWQLRAKDAAGARDSLQRAAKAAPKSAEAWMRLGLLEETAGRRAEARRHYLAAIERDAYQPVALNNLVMLGLADGEDPVRLELMARRALKALPDNPAVHDSLAQVLRARKDKKGALAAGQQAAKLAPQDPALLLSLAELQQWNGDRAAARKSAEQVLALQASGKEADKAKALIAKL